jgi:hypothetical protein
MVHKYTLSELVLCGANATTKSGTISPNGHCRNYVDLLIVLSYVLVGTAGFEPATPCPPDKYATRLRYAPNRAAHGLKHELQRSVIINEKRQVMTWRYKIIFGFNFMREAVELLDGFPV